MNFKKFVEKPRLNWKSVVPLLAIVINTNKNVIASCYVLGLAHRGSTCGFL